MVTGCEVPLLFHLPSKGVFFALASIEQALESLTGTFQQGAVVVVPGEMRKVRGLRAQQCSFMKPMVGRC